MNYTEICTSCGATTNIQTIVVSRWKTVDCSIHICARCEMMLPFNLRHFDHIDRTISRVYPGDQWVCEFILAYLREPSTERYKTQASVAEYLNQLEVPSSNGRKWTRLDVATIWKVHDLPSIRSIQDNVSVSLDALPPPVVEREPQPEISHSDVTDAEDVKNDLETLRRQVYGE